MNKVERVIVVGAGVAGLMSALSLQRQGISVHILERDSEPQADIEMSRSTDWRRKGVPQSLHPHHYMATMRLFLQEHYPEIIEHMISAGALKSEFRNFVHPRMMHRLERIEVNDELHSFMARRATFELVLRSYVLAQPGISICNSTRVTDLLTSESALPLMVRGVQTDAEQLYADVVIDASGRSGWLVQCLAERGVPMNVEQKDSGIWYLTRHYRLRPGQSYPAMYGMPGVLTGRYGVGAIPSDNDVFYVSFQVNHDDTDLIEKLRDENEFHKIASSHKEIGEWIASERAEPNTRVHGFGQIDSYWKQTVLDGKPGVLNFFPVGDTVFRSNPRYGRGCMYATFAAHIVAALIAADLSPMERIVRYEKEMYRRYRNDWLSMRKSDESTERAFLVATGRISPTLSDRFQRRFQTLVSYATVAEPALFHDIWTSGQGFLPVNAWTRKPVNYLRLLRAWLLRPFYRSLTGE